MKKILISSKKKTNFLSQFIYEFIYLYPNNNLEVNKNIKKNIKYISADFIKLRDNFFSENIAAKLSKEFIDEYIGLTPSLFPNNKNYNLIYWDIRKHLSIEIAKYLKCEYLADKIIKKEKIDNYKVFIDQENIDFKVLQLLKKKKLIKYSIPFFSLFKYFFITWLRLIFSFLYILIIPELKILFCRNQSKKKLNFKIGYNIFYDQEFDEWHGSPDFFIRDKDFDKNQSIFVANSRINLSLNYLSNHKVWIEKLKKKNYHLIDLNLISRKISKKTYLNSVYQEAKNVRNFFLKNIKILKLLNIYAANIINLCINWKIFYQLYNVNHFFSSMICGENITNFIQSQNSSSNFIYFSTTGELLDKRKFQNHTEWIQYSYLKYDNFFGSKLSYKQFKSYENTLINFYDVGNFAVKKIVNTDKISILKNLRISSRTKLITFFDDTWAFGGTQSFESYDKYLDSILKISNLYSNWTCIFRPKKNYDYFLRTSNNLILEKIDQIMKSDKIIFFDSDSSSKKNIDAHNLIAVSDLNVFSPMSSLSYDALCSKKKLIVFDPDKIYDNKKYVHTNSELLYTKSYDELLNSLKFWQESKNDNMINILNEKLTKNYIDKFCDEKSCERFINFINTE